MRLRPLYTALCTNSKGCYFILCCPLDSSNWPAGCFGPILSQTIFASAADWIVKAIQEEVWPLLDPSVYQARTSVEGLSPLSGKDSSSIPLLSGCLPRPTAGVSPVNVTGPRICCNSCDKGQADKELLCSRYAPHLAKAEVCATPILGDDTQDHSQPLIGTLL